MVSINELPPVSVKLINKLLIAKDVYQAISLQYADILLHEELKRLALEKKIFLKDFQSIKGFDPAEHKSRNEEEIRIGKENLILKFNHLFLENDEEDLIKFIIEFEKKLTDFYYLLFRSRVEDDFIRMIFKYQLDETERSIRELEELKLKINA